MINIIILKNEDIDSANCWINACINAGYKYTIIDIIKSDWQEIFKSHEIDLVLTCPPGREPHFKQLYDEAVYIINIILGIPCYPNFNEIIIYENKRFLSYWLTAQSLPHPNTYVFYDYLDAKNFLFKADYPIVSKLNIGASGRGVKIIRNFNEGINYINTVFKKDGINPKYGPNFRSGSLVTKVKATFQNPSILKKYFKIYKQLKFNKQSRFCIFQDFINHNFEWRIVRIGNSYFGHKKLKVGEMASGSKGIDYATPPIKLLDFVRNMCDKFNLRCMSIDLFETEDGTYLINEMQTIFGHVQSFICAKNDVPGRFVFQEDSWKFEPGLFNGNLSYNLRLEDAIGTILDLN